MHELDQRIIFIMPGGTQTLFAVARSRRMVSYDTPDHFYSELEGYLCFESYDKHKLKAQYVSGFRRIIKYIGKVQFADGLWLGLEMRNERGKHDGVVKDVRYFTCKQGRGLFVRPSAVTVRGINGALLVKESNE
ncbi:hypothetical protein QYM36_005494 [Artemia franciscana]|uniref:CAP-Gly domain-containing protein n=1 Tax=Artemia franciscana TaxID=6661 RepID=A0AA88I198_ARTSF|nr:hypothetical protein QYM36_005494 [Artemia franciscana]